MGKRANEFWIVGCPPAEQDREDKKKSQTCSMKQVLGRRTDGCSYASIKMCRKAIIKVSQEISWRVDIARGFRIDLHNTEYGTVLPERCIEQHDQAQIRHGSSENVQHFLTLYPEEEEQARRKDKCIQFQARCQCKQSRGKQQFPK